MDRHHMFIPLAVTWLRLFCAFIVADRNTDCENCRTIVKGFISGIRNSTGKNFGGGNTLWEEKYLGSYAYSEIRFNEIIESVCDSVSVKRAECDNFVENFEHYLEQWWKKEFSKSPNNPKSLEDDLCIQKAVVCCPFGSFGPTCTPCASCSPIGGSCDGNGTHFGTGKCVCFHGYVGSECNECNYTTHYRRDLINDSYSDCSPCHISCTNGCFGSRSNDCVDCASGWVRRTDAEEPSCVDIDECENHPCNSGQFCLNTIGAYKCLPCNRACDGCTGPTADDCLKCATGFQKGNNETCEDINECNADSKLCQREGEFCRNTIGSYSCACQPGYSLVQGKCVLTRPSKSESSSKSEQTFKNYGKPKRGRDHRKIIWTVTYTKEFLKYLGSIAAFCLFCWLAKGHTYLIVFGSLVLGAFVYFQSLRFDVVFSQQL